MSNFTRKDPTPILCVRKDWPRRTGGAGTFWLPVAAARRDSYSLRTSSALQRTGLLTASGYSGGFATGAIGAGAQEYTAGEVTKIDAAQKKLTIRHEELTSLDMPAMTMVFVVADESMIGEVKVGQKIEFIAERVNGRITVTDIK